MSTPDLPSLLEKFHYLPPPRRIITIDGLSGVGSSTISRILAKLGLRDRVQLVVFAFEHGLA